VLKTTLRVLIVEDEPIIAMLVRDVVTSLGHLVCDIVATEADAVATALTSRPDLMIVDAGLRSGSGVSAMQTILKQRPMPHIFVTGDKRNVLRLAPDATILEKPFFIPDLERAIDEAMAGSAA
jgi:two-component system, response regulator PdtaR